MSDGDISRLASLFSPNTLETVALRYFGVSEAEIGQSATDNMGNSERFNRDLLLKFMYKGHNRKVNIIRSSLYIYLQFYFIISNSKFKHFSCSFCSKYVTPRPKYLLHVSIIDFKISD